MVRVGAEMTYGSAIYGTDVYGGGVASVVTTRRTPLTQSRSVIISDIGGANPQRIATNGVDRSWAVDVIGTLSAEMLTKDLVRAGLNRPKGKWLWVDDNDAGLWAGEIQDSQHRADGTTEITASDWRALFSKMRLSKRARPVFGPAGALALHVITDAERHSPVWSRDRLADENGLPVQVSLDGQTLRDALDSLQGASGQEWWIDAETMAFQWGRAGLDKRGSVQLVAPRHVIDFAMPDSIEPVVNDLMAFPTNERYVTSQAFVVEDAASIAAFGRRQGEIALQHAASAAAARPTAQALVEQFAAQGVGVEMQVVNTDRCFGWFREGDVIEVLLPSINAQVTVRIMARALRDTDYVMDVSGIVLDWRTG